MLESMAPATAMRWLLLAALVYLIWPLDLIPDRLGLFGRLDDVLLIGWLAWANRGRIRELMRGSAQQAESSGAREKKSPPGEDARPRATRETVFDPHAVLGVPRSASSSEIRAAYHARMKEYHPDKVAHLGSDLQKLAHEKSQEIQRAYRVLRD